MIFPKEFETYSQAISPSEEENWLQPMQEKFKSVKDTNTWTLKRPKDKNIIPGKRVYEVES